MKLAYIGNMARRTMQKRQGEGQYRVSCSDNAYPEYVYEATDHKAAAQEYLKTRKLSDGTRLKVLHEDTMSSDWDMGIGTHFEVSSGRPLLLGRHEGEAGVDLNS